jgi:hypothetical protein
MSVRRQIMICLAVVATLQLPTHAMHSSPFHATGVLRYGEAIRSGDGCTELRFSRNGEYYNRLEFRPISDDPSCGSPNWDSYSDYDWAGRGVGEHQSSLEPRGHYAAEAVMQADGNFVVYNTADGTPIWATHTAGNPGAYLNVQGDGNLVIYSASDAVLWSLF